MFRHDSCAFYVLRFVLIVLLFLYGMQWVIGRLFPYQPFLFPSRHFMALPRFPAARRSSARQAQAPDALAESLGCAGAAARSAPGRRPLPDACL